MKWLKFHSLQARLAVLLLIPVTLILLAAGGYGFIYGRKAILSQWNEAAILKLQRAAHQIDMRLNKPMELLKLYFKSGATPGGRANQHWIIGHLQNLDGVTNVQIRANPESAELGNSPGHSEMTMPMHRQMHFRKGVVTEIIPPKSGTNSDTETVRLIAHLFNEQDRKVGDVVVEIQFKYLLSGIQQSGWWQSDMACIIDKSGAYLVHTNTVMRDRRILGETRDPLELDILEQIKNQPSATIQGPGSPPTMVAGFHSLEQAPWAILIFAPGEEILKPVIRLRNRFAIGAAIMVVIVVLLVRLHVGKIVRSVKEISASAHKVARGGYGPPIVAETDDEIGDLILSHNTMVAGLKERDLIRNTFGRYIDPDFAKRLLSRPEASQIGGQKREVVVLMSDIRGFTPLVEAMDPEMSLSILNQYLTHMIEVIHRFNGIIVDFVGDAILVFFEPMDESLKELNLRGVQCALTMQRDMKQLKKELRDQNHPVFDIGIGIHSGKVVVGNIGSKTRTKYGIVGSPVNLTQRIQDQAGGGEIIITEKVAEQIKKHVRIERSFQAKLKGVGDPIKLHAIIQKTGGKF